MNRTILKVLWLTLWVTCTAAAAPILTIQPDVPKVSSCLAFGAAPGSGVQGDADSGFIPTSPNMGFIYKDIPAFDLNPGDVLAFDLGDVNDFDIALDIEMATTTANGETTEAGPFVKIVNNTYVPLKARGDTIIDNFDLRFLVDSTYSFPGGGLIIRFSNGSTAYRNDNQSCDQVGVVGMSTDASGYFVLAFWDDDDGISPWGPQQPPISLQEEIIGGFQIIAGPTVLLASDTLDQSDTPITATTVGETITYRVKAQNPDPSDATGVTVTEILDDFVSFVPASQNPPAAVVVFDPGPPATLEWTVGSLAPGAEASLEVDLDVLFDAGSQTISNSAEVTASDAPLKTGLIDQSDIAVEPAIDIVGEMLDPSDVAITTVKAGEPFVYRIVASNPSQLDGSGVEITVTLPENLQFQQADPTPPTTTVVDAGPPETVVWTIGNLISAGDATLDIDVIPLFASSGATLSGTAALTAPSQGDDILTAISIDRAIDISSRSLDGGGASISTARTGDSLGYEIVVRNDSQADATGLEVTATLSEQLDFQQSTPTPAAIATFNAGPPGTIVWEINALSPGAEATLLVDLDVPFAASGQSVSNQADVTGSDAALLIGDTTVSEITISNSGADLLNGGSGNCFIATAAYGSYLEPEVMVLRHFRDEFLLTNEPGRTLVAWYYRNSPGAAALIADHETARTIVRVLLTPIVYLLKYPLAAILSLLPIGFVIGWGRRSTRLAR